MLAKRVLVAVILLPIGLAAMSLGGWVYWGVIALILGLASAEYVNLFRAGGLQPSRVVVVGGTLAVALGRYLLPKNGSPTTHDSWIIGLFVLLAMGYHLAAYERGRDESGTDFTITLGGILYFGLLGGYLISMRALEDGLWWVLVTLPAVWLADSGAYFIGRKFGRRKLSPRLSPKKTWEGYLGGVLVATLGTPLLTLGWQALPAEPIAPTLLQAGIMGFVLAIITPLGDLGESMIKRQVGIKDSSNLLPGHGGAFDRIDSWLWAGIIGYYLIIWFFI